MTLRNTIEELARTFAEGVLQAIRGAKLQEILGASGDPLRRGVAPSQRAPRATKPRRVQHTRRSSEDLASVIEAIVLKLKDTRTGMRSEELQKARGLDKKTITRPLTMALDEKMIRKTGQKRSTTYFAR